jgi:hypothetical protein
MTRRNRDLLRLLQAEAGAVGATVWIERTGGNHLKAIFSRGGARTFIIMALTPSCRRSNLNVRTSARHALRTLTT